MGIWLRPCLVPITVRPLWLQCGHATTVTPASFSLNYNNLWIFNASGFAKSIRVIMKRHRVGSSPFFASWKDRWMDWLKNLDFLLDKCFLTLSIKFTSHPNHWQNQFIFDLKINLLGFHPLPVLEKSHNTNRYWKVGSSWNLVFYRPAALNQSVLCVTN